MATKYMPMEKLKRKRMAAGITQKELAKIVGVDSQTIYFYETGYRFPRRDILYKLANALNCELADII